MKGLGNFLARGSSVADHLAYDKLETIAIALTMLIKRKTTVKIINFSSSFLYAYMKVDDGHLGREKG
jgi:hypothetical protein